MTGRLGAIGVAAALLALGCGPGEDGRANEAAESATTQGQPGSRAQRLERSGLGLVLPSAWDGFTAELGAYEPNPAIYAANVAWPPTSGNIENEATKHAFERLPADGIVITASAGRYGATVSQALPMPVQLADGYFLADAYEGQPARNVSTQLIAGRIGERYLVVQVYFGRNHPTEATRAEADGVLATLELGPEPAPGSDAGWREHRDDEQGIVARYPPGWHAAAERLTPALSDPVELLHLATYPLRPGGERCTHVPEHALEDLGPTDALVSIHEWRDSSSGSGRPRPDRFLPFEGSEPESRRCLDPAPDDDLLYRMHEFADAGRQLVVYVAIGEDADFARRREVAEIVDALRFELRD